MHHVCLCGRICEDPLLSSSQHRPGINTVRVKCQTIDRPVSCCLIKTPVPCHRWFTNIWHWPERCRYCAVIDELLSDPELKQLRAGQRIRERQGLPQFTDEIDNNVQTFGRPY